MRISSTIIPVPAAGGNCFPHNFSTLPRKYFGLSARDCFLRQRLDFVAADAAHIDRAEACGEELREGEGPPHRPEPANLRKQEGGGRRYGQLANDRNDEDEDAVAERLVDREGDDTEPGDQEALTDNP